MPKQMPVNKGKKPTKGEKKEVKKRGKEQFLDWILRRD